MPLDVATLETSIFDALIKAFSSNDLPPESKAVTEERYRVFASELREAIDVFVRSGTVVTTVNVVPPSSVIVSGTPGVGTGVVT